jgi:alpha-D-ribose 1-methylphosphonate 5-triphosphate synthase subunit PhnI
MGYVAVKGGRDAIEASLRRMRYERLKSGRVLRVEDAAAGLGALVDQVMSESSLHAPGVAAVAIKQAEGSPEEAVFLMRAFRSTLPRSHYSLVADCRDMVVQRRISACFKEIPGGQLLGASADYTHRLIDFDLVEESVAEARAWLAEYLAAPVKDGEADGLRVGRVSDYLRREGLLKPFPVDDTPPLDVTKRMLDFPTVRSERLQVLTRAQTGALTALGYAALRGYGALHPTVGELRVGLLSVHVPDPRDPGASPDDAYYVGEIRVTEVETLIPVTRDLGQGKKDIEFEIGYGACLGQNETKAIAMSLIDQCLETGNPAYPTHDEEFVLLHVDSVEATGFISHLKLPHYVTFQSKLDAVRKTRLAGAEANHG